jgi:hypothetical protein
MMAENPMMLPVQQKFLGFSPTAGYSHGSVIQL